MLKEIAFAGYLALNSITGLPSYGIEHLRYIHKPAQNVVYMSYDVDGDDIEDIREYRMHDVNSRSVSDPFLLMWDKNKNHRFEPDEIFDLREQPEEPKKNRGGGNYIS